MEPVKVNNDYKQQDKRVDINDTATSVLEEKNESNVFKRREIVKIEFNPAIYPKYAEVGKLYVVKNEIIHKIIESEIMLYIYTDSCGIKYGTPISIYKKDVKKVTYGVGYQGMPMLFI
jgi:hypothetical protein